MLPALGKAGGSRRW